MFSFYINKAFCYPFCFCTFCQHTLGSVTSFSQLIILRDNRVCILYKYFCDDFSNFLYGAVPIRYPISAFSWSLSSPPHDLSCTQSPLRVSTSCSPSPPFPSPPFVSLVSSPSLFLISLIPSSCSRGLGAWEALVAERLLSCPLFPHFLKPFKRHDWRFVYSRYIIWVQYCH